MGRYLVRRIALAILVVVGVVVLTFVIARVVPGDPAVSWAGPHASREQIANVRHELGLDRSLPVQIVSYFGGVVRGDWGTSIHTHQPVLSDIMDRAPASIELVVTAMVFALTLAIPLGLVSARWSGRAPDGVIRIGAVLSVSMPAFWLALILQLVFFQRLHLLPVAGQYDPNLDYTHPLTQYTHMPVIDSLITGNWVVLRSALAHLVLPAITLGLAPLAFLVRLLRANLLDISRENFIVVVRSKGLGRWPAYARHALPNAFLPTLTASGLLLAQLLTGSVLVEKVFN
nr:ABC transporter permease [Actinomycetota bacterium]